MSTNARCPTCDIKTNHLTPNEATDTSSEVKILFDMPITKSVVERKQNIPDKGSEVNSKVFLDQLCLDLTRTIIVMLDKMWDVSAVIDRYLSMNFIVLDGKGNMIHYSVKETMSHNFLRLKEGSIYSVKKFAVKPNKEEYHILKNDAYMLEFDGSTTIRKASVKADGFIIDSRGVVPTKKAGDAKKAIQEMAEYSQKWHNGTSRGRSTKNFDGLAAIQAQLNNLGREIKKVNEKVYTAQVGCEQCKGPHYTKDCPLKEEGKTLEEAYYTNKAKPSYQERSQSMKDTLSKFMGESAKRHKENSNLIKEIRASTNAAISYQEASFKTLEIQIGKISKVLQERRFGSLPSSTETNLRHQVKSISTTIEADSHPIRSIRSPQYARSTRKNRTLIYETRQMMILFPNHLNGYYYDGKKGSYRPQFSEAYSKASHIDESMPQNEKDPGSFTLPCFINNFCFDNPLVDLGASVSVMPLLTYLNLGLGGLAHTKLIVELADRTVKYPKGIAKNILVRIGKFTFPIDFIILDMPEDIKMPLILGRPFLSIARAKIDVYKRKITLRVGEEKIIFKSVKPASSLIKRVYMLNYIKLNDLNGQFELRRNQGDDLMPTIEEGKVIEEFRTRDKDLDIGIDDYPILEDMGAYRDDGIGDVIVGEPFLREVGIKARRFGRMITIYNGNDEVTYQMVRSHPRFKRHTNEQCNKIPPLLKVSEKVEKNGISHAYQKLKGFYKGVLNLEPDYI
ncbi:mitochondrial proton/calcium exchanger protein-like protein isoform X1 [Tanacetum coccineum]